MNKRIIATEIKYFQKIAIYALLIGAAIFFTCLIVFNPWKFDSKKYKDITGVSYSGYRSLSSPLYSPYWWSKGFFDYCDNQIGFNSEFPQMSYKTRKDYLISKSWRYGFYAVLLVIGGVAIYRYAKIGQKWVDSNSNQKV